MKTIRKTLPARAAALALVGVVTITMASVAELAAPRTAHAQDVDEGAFYSGLAPYGEWYYQADFGWVWHPTHVTAGWRPYTEGQWVWSDEVGWTWASDEPWGWATCHYGRWYFDPIYGWTWVPGQTWAPAWVDWREEDGYVGWAPLWPAYFDIHPELRWDGWYHDREWNERHHGDDWNRWVFTRDRDFTAPRISRVEIRDRGMRDQLYRNSHDVMQGGQENPERIGHSIDRSRIASVAAHPIRTVHLETSDHPEKSRIEGDRMQVFRGPVREQTAKTPDVLGVAKPVREQRASDTIKQEKERLDRVSGGKTNVRERNGEPGGAAEAIDHERGAGGAPNAGAGQTQPRANEPGQRGATREGETAGQNAQQNPQANQGQAHGHDQRMWPRGEQPNQAETRGQQGNGNREHGMQPPRAQQDLTPADRHPNDRREPPARMHDQEPADNAPMPMQRRPQQQHERMMMQQPEPRGQQQRMMEPRPQPQMMQPHAAPQQRMMQAPPQAQQHPMAPAMQHGGGQGHGPGPQGQPQQGGPDRR